jgi:peptidoglycan hydrolase-like protein with peptidoglycan-binding domain
MNTTVSKWTTALAVTVGGVMLATSAIAQSGAVMPKPEAMKSAPSQDTAQKADRTQVKAVQQALKDKGHNPGAVDGEMGPKTEAALRDYQQKEGLTATGTADAETMAKLIAAASPSPGSPTETSKDSAPTGATQTK